MSLHCMSLLYLFISMYIYHYLIKFSTSTHQETSQVSLNSYIYIFLTAQNPPPRKYIIILINLQVTTLGCGGMILCTAINHCLCDGIGTSQFLHAWAELTRKPESELSTMPFHWRHVLKPREPAQVKFHHAGYPGPNPTPQVDLLKFIQIQSVI